MPDQPKKRRLWEVDPSIFDQGRKASFFERRITPVLRQIGKFVLYGIAIAYPLYLVYVGLAFGGLVFWSFFGGSLAVMGAIIYGLGYSSNFRHWDISLKRTTGFLLGFVVATGFYAELIYLRTWFTPVALLLLGLGVFFVLRRFKS